MQRRKPKNQRWIPLGVTATIVSFSETVGADNKEMLDKIQKLENRIAELEDNGPMAESAMKADGWEAWIGATKFSGFASASYLYNFNRPSGLTPNFRGDTDYTRGRPFDATHNEFTLNKIKLTLEKPVAYNPHDWNVGYRADLIFGQDATLIQSRGLNLGTHGDIEQLYTTFVLPVGRGVQISVGKGATLLGVEVIEETANPNRSQGNQFLFAKNFTSTGVQIAYEWTDKIDTQFRVFNGWDVVKDNNDALSYMGRIGFAPDDKTSIGLVGYAGPEQAANTSDWRKGINLVVSRKITPKLTAWVQGDYGHEDANAALPKPGDAKWWAAGLWMTYAFTDKVGVAIRGDYLDDKDGARTSAAPITSPFAVNTGQELTSLTLTLNLKPYKNLQVRPELRWDHSSANLFGNRNADTGQANQVTASLGVAYLF